MLTNAPKGTKDVLPKESYKWQYVENEFAKICDLSGTGRYSDGRSGVCIIGFKASGPDSP